MLTSNTDDSIVSQSDCKQKFIISAINQLICDSNDLVFTKLLLIECIECHQRFESLSDNYKHFLDIHKPFENTKEINESSVQKIPEKPKISKKCNKNNKNIKNKAKDQCIKERNKFVCDLCQKCFTRNTALKKHLEIHSNERIKSHVCGYDGCTRAYSQRDYMLVHRNIHLNPKICDICGYSTSTNTQLKLHKRKHSDDRPYCCSWPGCEYTCKLNSSLQSHTRTHIGDKPYKCDYEDCPNSYASATALNDHKMRQHLKIKNWVCSWPGCESKFVSQSGLITHIKMHKNERRYSCDWPDCHKRFNDSEVLKRHKYTHTGERPFHCLIDGCTASFSNRGTLGTHKKLIHKCNEIKRARWDRPKKSKTN